MRLFHSFNLLLYIEPESPEYGYKDIKEHEAGYDSFMTGVCFLGLVKKLNIENKDISSKCPNLRPLLNKYVFGEIKKVLFASWKEKTIKEFPIMTIFNYSFQRIFVMRLTDIYYIDLTGSERKSRG